MTAQLVPPDVATEVALEVAHVAGLLGSPVLRVPGACGLLAAGTRSTTWVHGPRVDTRELVAHLSAAAAPPELLVAEGVEVDAAVLAGAGWSPAERTVCLRHPHPARLRRGAPLGYEITPVQPHDMPELRAVVDSAFGTDDSADVLPDSMLAVPGIRLLAVRTAAGALAGAVGARERARGRLLFALATAPQHRGRGLAAALVSAAATWPATPHVDVESGPATVALYRALGFRERSAWRRWSPDR